MSQKNSNPSSSQNPSTTELAQQRTDLAKYRSRAAADRTLMAWIRTSLSLIGFGFGIPTLVTTIARTRVGQYIDNTQRYSILFGLAFIAVGVFSLLTALRVHYNVLKLIATETYTYDKKTFNATAIAALSLLVIGLASFIAVLLEAING